LYIFNILFYLLTNEAWLSHQHIIGSSSQLNQPCENKINSATCQLT